MDRLDGTAAAELLAAVHLREAELARLDEEFAAARVTARSADRSVAVTVDVRGHVVGVELTPSAVRAHSPQRLGPLITELAGRAASSLEDHYRRRAGIARESA
ncbi:hypothetical protein GCM10027289_00330 [Tsukamurella serpentis]